MGVGGPNTSAFTCNANPPNIGVIFAGVDKVRFKRPVNPGDIVDFNSSIISEKRGIWKFDCRAEVGGELVCEAVVLCADRSI